MGFIKPNLRLNQVISSVSEKNKCWETSYKAECHPETYSLDWKTKLHCMANSIALQEDLRPAPYRSTC